MTNEERFFKYAQRHNLAETEEILNRRLTIIPEQSRKVLETRWGLNGSTYCSTFNSLGAKLEVQNPRELHDTAIRDLKYAACAEIIVDRDKFDNWNIIVGLGMLARAELGVEKDQIGLDVVSGKKLLETVRGTLTSREAQIIILRFGLEGNKRMLLEEVAEIVGVTRMRVRQIENKTIRKLRHPCRKNLYYNP